MEFKVGDKIRIISKKMVTKILLMDLKLVKNIRLKLYLVID